jgi:hypothetical protein
MGNHDDRNVGYLHFEDFFGSRDSVTAVEVAGATRRSWRSTHQPDAAVFGGMTAHVPLRRI